MKRAMLVVFSLLMTPSLFADAGSRLIPAGALVSCTSPATENFLRRATAVYRVKCVQARRLHAPIRKLPLGGQFAEYKDPGHFSYKGWMELDFDRQVDQINWPQNRNHPQHRIADRVTFAQYPPLRIGSCTPARPQSWR